MSSAAARNSHLPLDAQAPAFDDGPARERQRQVERETARLQADHRAPEVRARGADRRGPFRPGRLVPIRSRLSGPQAAANIRRLDALVIWILAFTGFWSTHGGAVLSAPLGGALPYALSAALLAWALPIVDAYRFSPRESLSGHLLRVAGAFGLVGLAMAAVMALTSPAPGLAAALALWFCAAFSCVYLAHVGWWRQVAGWRAAGRLTPNIVVVGATRNAEKLIQSMLDTREANVLGVFDDRHERAPDALCGVPVLGGTDALLGHRMMPYVDRVVIAVPASAQGRVSQLIERLRVLPNDVSLFLEFAGSSDLSRLADAPLAQVCGGPRNETRAGAKRAQDQILGAVILLAALPIMALTALAVRLDSPGPVLFRQRRHGFNNEEITVWKFRSMRHETADATASRQVTGDDERITRVGRVIRRTSLDELPQILNVLKGEMSLVGPRPHAIGMKTGDVESARLVAEYAHRHRIKPGITGWAAIKGSRGPVHTPEEVRRRVALDVEYIERQSLWLDLYIMLMTLPCLLGDRAAVR